MGKKWVPGINHIEYWVANLDESIAFYDQLFDIIGWYKLNRVSYSTGSMEIYFKEVNESIRNTLGPRHICFQATSTEMVDKVGEFLRTSNSRIIRGPLLRNEYSEGYYTVDFYDPNGYVIEVAYTPNMVL